MNRSRPYYAAAFSGIVLLWLTATQAFSLESTSPNDRLLLDQRGHSVQLPTSVKRVGTPGISLASLILALGGRSQLYAITPEVQSNPWLRRIMPEISRLPTPFVRPAGVQLESLLIHKPDLVTLWLNHQGLGERLERLGLPVLYVGYRNAEEMHQAARLLGHALGPAPSQRAEAFIQYYQHTVQRVAQGLTGLGDAERPRVYYAALSPLHTEGQASMVTTWIEQAGGLNVAAQAGLPAEAQVSLEQLLVWQPHVIITLEASTQAAILKDPRWQSLPAVRDGRVWVNPKGINAWCTRAAETALQVLWAAQSLHPARFQNVDLVEETRRFYQQFYQYALTDAEIQHILRGADPSDLLPPRSAL